LLRVPEERTWGGCKTRSDISYQIRDRRGYQPSIRVTTPRPRYPGQRRSARCHFRVIACDLAHAPEDASTHAKKEQDTASPRVSPLREESSMISGVVTIFHRSKVTIWTQSIVMSIPLRSTSEVAVGKSSTTRIPHSQMKRVRNDVTGRSLETEGSVNESPYISVHYHLLSFTNLGLHVEFAVVEE
jgi:hypothetical protein